MSTNELLGAVGIIWTSMTDAFSTKIIALVVFATPHAWLHARFARLRTAFLTFIVGTKSNAIPVAGWTGFATCSFTTVQTN